MMSYKKALEEMGILRERNISRLQQLAKELDSNDPDHDDDVNIIYKHLCSTKLSLFTNILRNPYCLCYVSYHEFLMHDTTFTE